MVAMTFDQSEDFDNQGPFRMVLASPFTRLSKSSDWSKVSVIKIIFKSGQKIYKLSPTYVRKT